MKITKHEHAFLELELNGSVVLVDPGSYTPSLPEIANVVAICLTHIHDDHSYRDHIESLL